MNIGVDIRCLMSPIRTGVGEYTYELLDALFKIDRENQYFLFYNSAKDAPVKIGNRKWEMGNVHFVGTKYPNKLFNLSLQILKQPKLDRVTGYRLQVTGIDIWFSPNLGFTALSQKVRKILTIHDLSFEHFPDCYSAKRRLWHRALNPKRQCEQADLILTPSEHTRRDVVETYGISERKVQVLRPGISPNFRFSRLGRDPVTAVCGTPPTAVAGGRWQRSPPRAGPPLAEDFRLDEVRIKYNLPKNFILFLGTIEPRKNILGLIEAYKHLSQMSNVKCQMLIAGPLGWKYEPILKAIAETPGARYIGYVAPEDKPALYQLADLFVYPSLYEGFGFPVLEAMASGVPVITSNRSSLPEVAGDAAYLVNPHNVSELARAMGMILTDEKLRALLIERGKRRAGEFRWENSARELIGLFTDP